MKSEKTAASIILKNNRVRYWSVIALLLGLIAINRLVEVVVVGYIDGRWEKLQIASSAEDLSTAVAAFQHYQSTANDFSQRLLHDTTFIAALESTGDQRDQLLFSYLHSLQRSENWSIEIYDSASHLIAWKGRSIPIGYRDIDTALAGKYFSTISQGTVYSYLSVISPLVTDKTTAVVVVSRTVEISYPFHNRFLASSGIQERVRKELDQPVEYIFNKNAVPVPDSIHVSAELMSIDGRPIGIVSLPITGKSEYLADVRRIFDHIFGGLVLLLSIIVIIIGWKYARTLTPWRKFFFLSCILWAVRYVLVFFEVPGGYIEYGIFTPLYFGSPFGYGIAQSLGDLLITVTIVVSEIVLFLFAVIETVRQQKVFHSRLLAAGFLIIAPGISSIVIRGYAASIWSAVFDSTITFNDPTAVIPDFIMGAMECTLFLLTCSLILFLIAFFLLVIHLSTKAIFRSSLSRAMWYIGGWLLAGGIVYGLLDFTQLITQWLRGGLVIASFVSAFWLYRALIEKKSVWRVRRLTYLVLGSVVVLLFVRWDAVYERDREKVQALALELIRPVDVWMEQTLSDVSKTIARNDEVRQTLKNEISYDRRQKVAFTTWAQSTLSREGYNSAVVVFDTANKIVSQFDIGIETVERGGFTDRLRALEANGVQPGQIRATRLMGDLSMYECAETVFSAENRRIGTVYIGIITSYTPVTRSNYPEILRAGTRPTLETSFQEPVFSEYRNGVMVSSTDEIMPRERILPPEIRQLLKTSQPQMMWVSETINDRSFRTLYVPVEDAGAGNVLGIGLVEQDFHWRIFIATKLMLFVTLLTSLLCILAMLYYMIVYGKPKFSFRTKLLFGLFCVSFVPLLILSYANRQIMVDQSKRSIQRELLRELDIVVSNLMNGVSSDDDSIWQLFDDVRCQQIAVQTGIDFYIFSNGRLEATSRPELFVSELVDLRLSADAYARTVIEGDNFYSEVSTIGQYPYTTGYRPIRDRRGDVAIVVAVPTITRQSDIQQDLGMVNAFLFAGYFIVAVFIVVTGSILAHRITLPLRALRTATQDIAHGHFDLSLHVRRTDEIGDLVQSFNTMAHELQQSREQLSKAERELAWKEMAKQVAHEIKNPLTPIKLSIQHLRQAYADRVENFGDILQRVTKTIIEQIEVLSRIASEFSYFARMPRRRLEECNINEMLDESVTLFQDEKRIAFIRKYADTMPLVITDREELRRAFVNILRNAVQAILQTGTITVVTVVEKGNIVVDIHDTGVGIPDEIRDKLFEPSFSTKTDGMGLGLALVKKTIEDLQGTITVISQPGEGTQVTITIPAATPAPQ
jgi:two-component system nitrogen regulation sensor histidine kinase NtrY